MLAHAVEEAARLLNADGAMVWRVRPDGSATLYAGLVEYELDAAGSLVTTTRYYALPGARAVRTGSGAGTLSWVLTDHLGSSTVTVDASGSTIVGELRYEAYGATRFSSGTMARRMARKDSSPRSR